MEGLKDSGSMREFGTGAHRDAAEGKGRMDLLPAGVVIGLLDKVGRLQPIYDSECINMALSYAFSALEAKSLGDLEKAAMYAVCACSDKEDVVEGYDSKNLETFSSSFAAGLVIVSKHYEAGAKKYGENNWQNGMPVSVCLDSGIRHACKAMAGIDDEPHFRAAAWNFLCALWFVKNKPDMNDVGLK